jgi:hypothetical protein
MMLDDEKQFTKIISKIRFIIENVLWLLEVLIIFDLAIIISAAIKILRMISVEDMVSMDENEEIEVLV